VRGADNVGAAVTDTGSIQAKHLGAITIGGSLVSGVVTGGGSLFRSGSVTASDDIGPFVVKGSIVGNTTQPVLITARGQATPAGTTDTAIQSLAVGGRVEFTNLLLGYTRGEIGLNADAQIGAVTVGGDWIASYLLVGVNPSDAFVGDANDLKLAGNFGAGAIKDDSNVVSKIASIVIGGGVFGTPGAISAADRFGFVAEQIGSFRANGLALALKAGPNNDTFALGHALPIGAGPSSFNSDHFEVHVYEV
jgi:hypothetical protein